MNRHPLSHGAAKLAVYAGLLALLALSTISLSRSEDYSQALLKPSPAALPPAPNFDLDLQQEETTTIFDSGWSSVIDHADTIRNQCWNPKVSRGEDYKYYSVMSHQEIGWPHAGLIIYENDGDPAVTSWTQIGNIYDLASEVDYADIEVVSSRGFGYVVYHRNDGQIREYRWQLTNPTVFSDIQIATGASNNAYCSITSDEVEFEGIDVYLYVCWKAGATLKFKRSTDSGMTWTDETTAAIALNTMMAGNSIAYCPRDNHVFILFTNGDGDVVVTESGARGSGSWTTREIMTNTNSPYTSGGIACMFRGYILATATVAGLGTDINVTYSTDAGTSWLASPNYWAFDGDQTFPSCAANKNGYFNILYYDDDGVMYSRLCHYTDMANWSNLIEVDGTHASSSLTNACMENGDPPDHGGVWSNGGQNGASYFGWASPELSITAVPYFPPIIIPASGGSFTYDLYLINDDNVAHTCDVWVTGIKPNGQATPPKYGPTSQTLDPGEMISLTSITQMVPSWVPAGLYKWIAKIGTFNTTVLDSDIFICAKQSSSEDQVNLNTEDPFLVEADQGQIIPATFTTLKVSPNPFNPTTTISYQLSTGSQVKLAIFNVSGRQVAELINGMRPAGTHTLSFDASSLPSGVYLARLTAGQNTQVQKLVLLK